VASIRIDSAPAVSCLLLSHAVEHSIGPPRSHPANSSTASHTDGSGWIGVGDESADFDEPDSGASRVDNIFGHFEAAGQHAYAFLHDSLV